MKEIPFIDHMVVVTILENTGITLYEKAVRIHHYAFDYISMAGLNWKARRDIPTIEQIEKILEGKE
jgi:hypothetical protein